MGQSAIATTVFALLLAVFLAPPGVAAESSVVTPAEVNAAVTPPGGIKAIQTGGNTVGDVIRETEPRADGYRHIDTPATIQALRRLGVNTYWRTPN